MDHSEFVHEQNIKRLHNLLETSINHAERTIIQKLLAEEEAKKAAPEPPHPG